MNIYFDTEFTGLHKDTTLISIGMVAENGKMFYAESMQYDYKQCDDWIKENVINNLFLEHIYMEKEYGTGNREIERKGRKYKLGWLNSYQPIGGMEYPWTRQDGDTTYCNGGEGDVYGELKDWLSQFDEVQFVSDVCHYDMVLLIDLFGGAFDLPSNVSAVCHDINQDIARHYGISDREAFDKSREDIVTELCGSPIEGRKHNALYDAKVIKAIYDEVKT